MGDKDVISKHLLKRIVRDVSDYLLQLNLSSIEILETVNQRVEDRRADMVALVESDNSGDNKPFLLHIEVENQNDQQMPLRMLRYYTDIAFQYPGYPIRQYVLYIGQKTLTIDDNIQDIDFCYRYNLIDMHQLDCEQFIQEDNPDALVLSILCDFKGRSAKDVINKIITRLHEITQSDDKAFREYLYMLEVLSTNRNLKNEIKDAEKMLNARIEELPSYEIGIEKGIEKGDNLRLAKIVSNMHQQGFSIDVISRLCETDQLLVEKIIDHLNNE